MATQSNHSEPSKRSEIKSVTEVTLERIDAYARGLGHAGFLYLQYPPDVAQAKLMDAITKAEEQRKKAIETIRQERGIDLPTERPEASNG